MARRHGEPAGDSLARCHRRANDGAATRRSCHTPCRGSIATVRHSASVDMGGDARRKCGRRARRLPCRGDGVDADHACHRSEEHTSELQSLMRNSYAVFCLKKKKRIIRTAKTEVQNECRIMHEYNSYTVCSN